ncbi:MAG: LuxR C-terminal-related transcriptional regulator [Bacteroidota bacterium]|jgi:DNA-binding NarL/FixJ family response regulator|nr:response regulator transcription factor [Ignavibacteria bacterium]HEX2962481.1 response regulator transcription factor [Ignavibacteriales bacterium]MCU7500847.1 response regulator transcription factor [Ignavibacteria bacterium]MCU7511774.1 response regulator transcription factor [Ignavibacteria bacterium]MCU7520674.1 response regulator transcription factor [Ignavibacteria bacterium]
MKKSTIFVIEDNRLLRDGICAILKKQSDMSVAAAVGNGENILAMMDSFLPEVVLLDLGLRSQNSLEVVKTIKKHSPEVKIIVMDIIPLENDVFEFVQAGATGFILKDADITEFIKTIRSVLKGERILPPNLTGSLFSQIVEHAMNGSKPSLIVESVRMTKRERQVILLIADGFTNKEIAQKLHLSTYTVKSHVHNILEKLSLHTRVQIANYAHISQSYKTATDEISFIGN